MSGAANPKSQTPGPAPAPLADSAGASLLESVLGETTGRRAADPQLIDRFLAETSPVRALRIWLGIAPRIRDADQLLAALNRDVAWIDQIISDQVNAILHHPSFQRLESSWRGLDFLVRQADEHGDPLVRIKVLNVSWAELGRDFDRAIEFDQSQLFRKVYENEFGSPGGEPFGILIGDYEIHPRLGSGRRTDDLAILESISGVAAAAFCPFIANASPAMFGLDDFTGLQATLDHARTMEQVDYLKWRSLRESEDSRFVGLAMPRILMRQPYNPDNCRIDRFNFAEDVTGPDNSKYLWGGAAFALGSVVLRAFADAGWPADIRGVRRGIESGGLVTGLEVHDFGTDTPGVWQKSTTDVVITDRLEKQLGDIGFIPLCHCHNTGNAAFYSVPSIQKPRVYDRAAATNNARISSMIQYMLCVSRFAHYIKAMGRDRVGSFTRAEEFERFLQDWLTRYVVLDDNASPETKSRYPLREARVQVRARPGSSGTYQCVIHLVPHYELDDMAASVRLTTEIAPPRNG
jgi:type VI secretion system ImpC/EvpB family protein